MAPRKVMYVRDPVHGNLRLSSLQEELLKTVEVQRLSFVHQLGMTFQSYPGAHCMRLSHALGVSHVATLIGRHVLDQVDWLDGHDTEMMIRTVQAAGMLHDIGHTPWSHTLEPLYLEVTGGDHMDLVSDLVTGRAEMPLPGSGRIPSILGDHEVDPERVAALINSEYTGHRLLQQMIFGEVDADMLDYLQRDFHFTGVSYGHIDMERIITTMTVADGEIVFLIKGLEAVRDFLFARMQMYSSVYLHRKTRIVDQMLLHAARRSMLGLGELELFWVMTDDEVLSFLAKESADEWVREMAWRVKYRQKLFSQVFRVDAATLDASARAFLEQVWSAGDSVADNASALAGSIAEAAGVDRRYVLVDLPLEAVRVSEERFDKLGIKFLRKDGTVCDMEEVDPAFAEYVGRALPNRSYLTVSCCPDIKPAVRRACEEIFHRAAMPLFPDRDNSP